ncbi:MAG TPA: HAD-IC family P-type ATPase, partial [Stenomitos sp.]
LDGGEVLLGSDLERISSDALPTVTERVSVYARLTPEQKDRVVRALKARGHVVGFLGDGINDAPSLRVADVGISVATAADVAKEAAPIILLDKSLAVLHQGVLEGRRSFANVIKYLMMGTSSNFGNMFSMAGAALLLPFLPMLPMQILLNNLLYDASQIALPGDRVDAESVSHPRRWNIQFLRSFMVHLGPLSSVFDFLTFWLLLGVFHAAPALFRTSWFLESLWTQTLVVFIIRTRFAPWTSRPSPGLIASVGAICALALLLPYTPLAPYLGFVALPPGLVLAILGLTLVYLGLAELVKRAFYRSLGTAIAR